MLDKRIWEIEKESLPIINTFDTSLLENTVDIGTSVLLTKNLLLIEGKPGIGKSHLATLLEKKYNNPLLYRFWIHNQDSSYKERLQYNNFIKDFSRKVFGDAKIRGIDDILYKLQKKYDVVIIDGLDHVENYAEDQLPMLIATINKMSSICKVIVLSRPILYETNWYKCTIANWNIEQTKKVLEKLYHITNYSDVIKIYNITDGYPILIRYISEHYKIHKEIPNIDKVKDIDDYYEHVVKKEKGKSNLSLFTCSRSYFMLSEINMILGDSGHFLIEYIDEHPYLFEKRLNRVSLFHDSFNTYLKKVLKVNSALVLKANEYIFKSIITLNTRFLSRFSLIDLNINQKEEILKKYLSLSIFENLINNCIDYESIQLFYLELRNLLNQIHFSKLSIIQYFDFALIENIINRNHIEALDSFNYTYVLSLLLNEYSEEDITSSGYIFSMLYYIKTSNAVLLLNKTNEDFYSTTNFIKELEDLIDKELITISNRSFIYYGDQIDFNLTLKELIFKYKEEGSFSIHDKIHNYLRYYLSIEKKIDIHNIYIYWTKYYQRRDYSAFFTPLILFVLESNCYISKQKCVEVINILQKISQKEKSHLLEEYINYYKAETIIPCIEMNFDTISLDINWFNLSSDYINLISDRTYKHSLEEVLKVNNYNREIKLSEIENILNSKWCEYTIRVLKVVSYSIVITENNVFYKKLKKSGIDLIIVDEDALSIKNIKKRTKSSNISPIDTAKILDHNGCSMNDFKNYEDHFSIDISSNFKEILYTSLTQRVIGGEYYSSLYYWPGTVLKLVDSHLDNDEFEKMARSFELYMQLSLFDFSLIRRSTI